MLIIPLWIAINFFSILDVFLFYLFFIRIILANYSNQVPFLKIVLDIHLRYLITPLNRESGIPYQSKSPRLSVMTVRYLPHILSGSSHL